MADHEVSNPSGEQGKEGMRELIEQVIEQYLRREKERTEPAYRAELEEERKRREALERRLNELIEENVRAKRAAEEAERSAAIRAELQRLGVTKVDLAFRAVKDDIKRAEDGRLVAVTEKGVLNLREYLTQFVNENPEFLPARNLGGSGIGAGHKLPVVEEPPLDLERIKPGMSREELERVRQVIARIAAQTLGAK